MRKKRKRLRSLGRKPIFRIPKENQNEKGEFTLKTDIVKNNVKKDPKPDYVPDKKDEEEYQAFLDKIKKEIKKGSKKKFRRAKPKNKK
jgi:hypothetical protein